VLAQLQQRLEGMYRITAPDIRRFMIGREQLDDLHEGSLHRDADEWVLVRETDEGIDLAVFIDEGQLSRLSQARCARCLVREAFRPFCSAVEAVSHFLLLVERARKGEPLRLLELEAQAEVDKYLALRLQTDGHYDADRVFQQLFRTSTFAPGLSAQEHFRYREAGRLAEGYCRMLEAQRSDQAVIDQVRAFYHRSGQQRLEQMRQLAA
jgi:hypothetical protein